MTVSVSRKKGAIFVTYDHQPKLFYSARATSQSQAYALAAKLMMVDDAADDVVRERLLEIIEAEYRKAEARGWQ